MKHTIALGADHAGYEYKNNLIDYLTENGYECIDCGTNSPESVDYPVHASRVCELVRGGKCDFGILVCGTGIGMSIAANKHRGIRAALCNEPESTAMTRHHNNANVLCLGARMISYEKALELTKVFLSTEFDGGRHERRVEMLDKLL
ncbi:MAG: ribose 5-phosphate isomerase B [Clostridia bacterium]|nr:ribose 5-phosphate isomerase B [Clostridia bacterium]